MIIGISGKKQVGKDLIANIIKYFVFKQKHPDAWATESFLEFQHHRLSYTNTGWAIVKFADKLKDIVCLILDCTREQLENETFKNAPLGEEWYKWDFGGNFDGPFYSTREGVLEVAKVHYLYIKNHPKDYKISYEDAVEQSIKVIIPTPRTFLQLIGTDCFRNMVHPNTWINSTMANYTPSSNWIISDVRFPGEVKAIHDKEGIVIRINRPNIVSTDQHESETALDDYRDFNYTIFNTGTIEELIEKVRKILIKEKIID